MNSVDETEILDTQSPPLESYVVRIYRRSTRSPARLTGTVEIVADGSELRFNGMRELQRILVTRRQHIAPIHPAT
jgi:hypothetical protein